MRFLKDGIKTCFFHLSQVQLRFIFRVSLSPTKMPGEICENYNASVNRALDYETIQSAADYIRSRTDLRPKIAIVCGSGLGHLSEVVDDSVVLPFSEIPNFPQTSVMGHKGNVVIGRISGQPVICLSGRFHAYEGHAPALCCLPIKVMKLLGVKLLVTTCAAGGVDGSYNKGDIMIIKDHINLPGLAGLSSLTGPNDDRFGPRFPPLLNIYQEKYRNLLKQIAAENGLEGKLREGVYLCIGGPAFETVAESRLMRNWGVGAVGMSVAHEVTNAAHMGMDVVGLSLISDLIPMEYETESHTTHQEVLDIVENAGPAVQKLVVKFIERVNLEHQ